MRITRRIKRFREYKGCIIWFDAGKALPWSSSTHLHGNLRADTLAGIKQLISEDMDHA